jgi:hypothetical protein
MARRRLAFGAEPMPNVDGVFCHVRLLVLDGPLALSPGYAGHTSSRTSHKHARVDGGEFISPKPLKEVAS